MEEILTSARSSRDRAVEQRNALRPSRKRKRKRKGDMASSSWLGPFNAFARVITVEVLRAWLARLPEVDAGKSRGLRRELCHATKSGIMPAAAAGAAATGSELCHAIKSGIMPAAAAGAAATGSGFADLGVHSGYIESNVKRASGFARALLGGSPARPPLAAFSRERRGVVRLASIGGGPGFDLLGASMLAAFLRDDTDDDGHLSVIASVFDYEPSWQRCLEELERVLVRAGFDAKVDFHPCDITRPLNDAFNEALLPPPTRRNDEGGALVTATDADVYCFSYVIAENALLLEQGSFEFFSAVFSRAMVGAAFVFVDSTRRFWPKIVGCADATAAADSARQPPSPEREFAFRVSIPQSYCVRNGLILVKGTRLSAADDDEEEEEEQTAVRRTLAGFAVDTKPRKNTAEKEEGDG